MLLDGPTLEGIVSGRIRIVFRTWRRPTVKTGGTLRTRIGVTQPFKARLRRLKELGLTESLKVGYRVSPRRESYLRNGR